MENQYVQETLDRILAGLNSDNEQGQLAAIQELQTIKFSSEAIVSQLERLALQRPMVIRDAALQALSLKTSQFVTSKRTGLNRPSRAMILREIETWQNKELLENHNAEVIKRQYDFDIEAGIPAHPAGEQKTAVPTSSPVSPPQTKPLPAKPPEPRPSLTQILLSENSIRIYLYLGAFFVIASAAILAAVIEAARLPILLIATLIFAGGSIGLKKRLPQPSFALAVVFSFLLLIDASVISDSINLSLTENNLYWAGALLVMTGIWAFGTWFYESRMFSLAAFIALLLGIMRFDNAVEFPHGWTLFTIGFANVISLIVIRMIQKWKDTKFAEPLFITAQASQLIVLSISLITISINIFESKVAPNLWIAHALIWLFAAAFFAASNLLVPFIIFPWTAVASLFFIPSLFLAAFDASASVQIAGFGIWGALMAFASEFIERIKNDEVKKYHYPLLTLSLPLMSLSVLWGLAENNQTAFAALLGMGTVYMVVNILRARWYVWSVALLAWLGAYFLFFTLPFMQKMDVYFGYQLLIASVLLLIPELFTKEPLTVKRSWNWPPIALGAILVFFNLLVTHTALLNSDGYFGRTTIIIGAYTLFFTAYAWRFKQQLIGYLATTSLALTVVYTLTHFDLDLWLPSLTVLSTIYYIAGYCLKRTERNNIWGAMLINSGLALGTIFSMIAFFTLKSTGGWYAIIIGGLFIMEMFTQQKGYLELFVISLFSAALIIFLNDFNVKDFAYYPFGISLIWLASDAILQRTFIGRKTEFVTRIIGGFAILIFILNITANNGLASSAASVCFAVYTIFFAAYALAYKKSALGYISTASAAITMFYALDHFNIEVWLPIFTGLSLVYYFVGFFIRKNHAGWSEMLQNSGLGLGTLISLVAPFQSGSIEKAIPIAIVATLYAVEAFRTRNVWLAFPANGLYLISYFTLLIELNVDEPQYFSIGAALLGMLMHYLLTRAESKTGAFIMGTISQLILLGTSYVQLVSTSQVGFFFVLFFQSLVIIFYGLYMRSRSLVFAPIVIVVLATLTILYNALQNLSLVIIIGASGIILLTLGILAVLMREKITSFVERFNDWNA